MRVSVKLFASLCRYFSDAAHGQGEVVRTQKTGRLQGDAEIQGCPLV
jgi:hypothetical protein